jgi:hypothetical protein
MRSLVPHSELHNGKLFDGLQPTFHETNGPYQTDTTSQKPDVNSLPNETIEFANKMFDAARNGESELLLAAIDAGLPVNLTNAKGLLYRALICLVAHW